MALILIAVALLATLAIAGLVGLFVAYPNRGRPIPRSVPQAEWLDETMTKVAGRVTEYVEGPGVTQQK